MKQILCVLTILISLVTSTFGSSRTPKEIEKLFKGIGDVEATMNGASFQPGGFNKTIYITESTSGINDIERRLLKEYKKVAFMCNMASKPFHCYFVIDEEDKRGVIGLDGEIIVQPLSGNICNVSNGKDFGILLVGEISRPLATDILKEWTEANRDYKMVGMFSSIIIDADKPSIHTLFPNNEYIFLSLGSKGNTKYDIFTCKEVGDDCLWGIVDIKGKEILPNKYTGFTRKTHFLDTQNTGLWGKWIGTTEMDMSEALKYSQDLKAATQRRRSELASNLNLLGELTMSIGETVETAQEVTGNVSQSSDNFSGSSLELQYNNWAKRAESNYNSLTNTGVRIKDGNRDVVGSNGQSASPSDYTLMKKYLREAQREMKEIRKKAKKKGINIKKSDYEDIQVTY